VKYAQRVLPSFSLFIHNDLISIPAARRVRFYKERAGKQL